MCGEATVRERPTVIANPVTAAAFLNMAIVNTTALHAKPLPELLNYPLQ
jgi:hypothetical protein